MPVKVFNFLPTLLNMANDGSASGFTICRSGDEINAGGLVLGDAMDLTNEEAASQSSPAIGMLFEGRYRRVQVAAGATAANIKRGTAAFVQPGTSVFAAIVLTPGSGQTPGSYDVPATGGGGQGAIIRVTVGMDGTVSVPPLVINQGGGYTSLPTFTMTAAGGTAATFQAQMADNSYVVTDAATAGINASQGRGLFLNSVTPGNYGWIQENGIGGFFTSGSGAVGGLLTPSTSTGQFTAAAAGAPSVVVFGTAMDQPQANAVIRGKLLLPTWNG